MIAAVTVSVPCVLCSTPRPVRMYAPEPPRDGEALASRNAARRSGRDGDAGDLLGPLGPPERQRAPDVVETRGPLVQVREVGEALREHDVREPEQQREVGAGHRLHVQAAVVGGQVRGRRAAGVDDDQAARRPHPGEVLDGRRHGLGEVRARAAGPPARRRGRPAGTAGRGRGRGSGWRRRRRSPCRTGRCSRCSACASTVRANLPSAYAFSLVSPPPPNTATDSGPCAGAQGGQPGRRRTTARCPRRPAGRAGAGW